MPYKDRADHVAAQRRYRERTGYAADKAYEQGPRARARQRAYRKGGWETACLCCAVTHIMGHMAERGVTVVVAGLVEYFGLEMEGSSPVPEESVRWTVNALVERGELIREGEVLRLATPAP